jgi:hypothetical protein
MNSSDRTAENLSCAHIFLNSSSGFVNESRGAPPPLRRRRLAGQGASRIFVVPAKPGMTPKGMRPIPANGLPPPSSRNLMTRKQRRLPPRLPGSRLRLSGIAQNAARVLNDPGSRFAWPGRRDPPRGLPSSSSRKPLRLSGIAQYTTLSSQRSRLALRLAGTTRSAAWAPLLVIPEAACGYPGSHKTQPAFSTVPARASLGRDDDAWMAGTTMGVDGRDDDALARLAESGRQSD